MRFSFFVVVLVAVLLTVAGCVESPSTTTTEDFNTTSSATSITAPNGLIKSVPSVSDCDGIGLPDPSNIDRPKPATYPDVPATQNETAIATYVARFERAYFRNTIIVRASADEDMNLTQLNVNTDVRLVGREFDGYFVNLDVTAWTEYEQSTGDRWPSIGYFVNDTHLIRRHIDDVSDPVSPESGTVVLQCD